MNRLLEEDGWGTWIRTRECRYQKPVPYRLAIPHPYNAFWWMVREARLELAHLAAPEPKSGASTNFATPAKKMVATTGFEPVTPSLWVMCSNQLSYVAIFFSRYLIGVAGRIMRIEPCSVNLFFKENCSKVTVWLGCEQHGAIFVNYCLLCVFSPPYSHSFVIQDEIRNSTIVVGN